MPVTFALRDAASVPLTPLHDPAIPIANVEVAKALPRQLKYGDKSAASFEESC